MSAFLALTCLTVILRLLARLVMGARYWRDDLCNILGMVCGLNALTDSLLPTDPRLDMHHCLHSYHYAR